MSGASARGPEREAVAVPAGESGPGAAAVSHAAASTAAASTAAASTAAASTAAASTVAASTVAASSVAADVTAAEALELPAGVRVREGTESLWASLKEVLDPEFPISVVDLGLIYDIRRAGGCVEVDLTFTAIACPCMDFIKDDVRERLAREPGVDRVVVSVVWDPPWTRERMTASAREVLRSFGVAA